MSSQPRYVVLRFDDGDRFDYEPPLIHPADVFLNRFPRDFWMNADIGATSAFEVDPSRIGCPDPAAVRLPPQERGPVPWLKGTE